LFSDVINLNSCVDLMLQYRRTLMLQYRRTLCNTSNYQLNPFAIRNVILEFFVDF